MTLKETLQADLTVALKAKDSVRVATIRAILGTVSTQEKSGKTAVEFDDEQIKDVIARQIKQRKESAEIYLAAEEPARAEAELVEASILEPYLPTQLTPEEVEEIVSRVISVIKSEKGEITNRDFGLVMKTVSAETRGRADGKVISELVRTKLG